jgi:hypothetical protein
MSGYNRARFAFFNSTGGERAHWGKVCAILRSREPQQSNGASSLVCSRQVSLTRKSFTLGVEGKCLHCHQPLEEHTKMRKLCPKGTNHVN